MSLLDEAEGVWRIEGRSKKMSAKYLDSFGNPIGDMTSRVRPLDPRGFNWRSDVAAHRNQQPLTALRAGRIPLPTH